MSIESELRELRQLVERIAQTPKVAPYLRPDRGMTLVSDMPTSLRRRDSSELEAADKVVAQAEAACEIARLAAIQAARTSKGQLGSALLVISSEDQERLPEFSILRAAEAGVVKARVKRAKLARRLDLEAATGFEPFMSRVARTVGLK